MYNLHKFLCTCISKQLKVDNKIIMGSASVVSAVCTY